MRAMILAAGLGTRLRPLTNVRPKVLVPVMGTPILDFWVQRLYRAGCEAVFVNAFHLHDRLAEEIERRSWPIHVHVEIEPVLLGTGGGLRNAMDFFRGEPFVAVNGDIVCDAPIREIYQRHLGSGCAASLVMHDFPEFNNVAVDAGGRILEFGREACGLAEKRQDISLMAFTGIHVIDPAILEVLEPGRPGDILAVYRRLIGEGRHPLSVTWSDPFWREMGAVQSYRNLTEELGRLPEGILPPFATGKRIFIDPGASVDSGARLKGFVVVGKGSKVLDGAELENVMLWDDVRVGRNSRLRNCIVADGVVVEGEHENEILTGGLPS